MNGVISACRVRTVIFIGKTSRLSASPQHDHDQSAEALKAHGDACYLTSTTRALPTITSGKPFVNFRTLFLTQSAALSLETSPSSALSNILMMIRAHPDHHRANSSSWNLRSGVSAARSRPAPRRVSSSAESRPTVYFLMLTNMLLSCRPASPAALHCSTRKAPFSGPKQSFQLIRAIRMIPSSGRPARKPI